VNNGKNLFLILLKYYVSQLMVVGSDSGHR